MNLTRVLDVALPEMPSLRLKDSYFRFNPATVVREYKEPKQTTIVALSPRTRKVFVFTPEQWTLVRLFDGRRSYEQVAALWRRKCGIPASVEAIRKFAESLDGGGFWHKTAQEESMSLMNELAQQRHGKLKKKKVVDVSKIYLFTFDADHAITKVHKRLKFFYNPWFVLASLAAILLMIALWVARWDEVWRDSLLYWNMTEKTFRDLMEFYLIFAIVGFFHESGHAVTAKHFGGEVHRTGLMLVYTTPAFYVDSSEVWVNAGRWQRVFTILAGFWVELMLCAVATLVWWGTAIGGTIHDLAYKVILVGGIMPILFNMNPLMRLDGYLAFCEIIRIQNLREKANLFWSNWVQKNIFKLPVGVPMLPRRRAIFFGAYSFLSGCYTYTVLLFLARLTYKILHNYSPEWAFLPATLVALRIFKSRIVKFLTFLKNLYLNKKDVMRAHWKPLIAPAVVVLALVFLPLWREQAEGPLILEAANRAVIRAEVPGRVQEVLVREGERVRAGAPLLRLRALDVESESARSSSQLRLASAAATDAQLRYGDYAKAEHEREQWAERVRLASDKERRLSLNAPISGTVVSPRMQDLQGVYVAEGTTLAEVDDLDHMRARIYVPEGDMRAVSEVTGHSLHLDALVRSLRGQLVSISPNAQELEAGLIATTKYKGLQPPPYYVALVLLPNDGTLRAGMTGEAKIYGARRSLAGKLWRPLADFVGRKIW